MNGIRALKIGGSIITDKNSNSKLNVEATTKCLTEIGKWINENQDNKLIVTLGAGSFGHPLAQAYGINDSTDNNKDSLGFLKINRNMLRMIRSVTRIAEENDIRFFSIPPSSVFITNKGRVVDCYIETILHSLECNLIPLLWGDAVFDVSHKHRILSGDQINTYLFERLKLTELLFGTNVNGIYSEDPRRNPGASMLRCINDENYDVVSNAISPSLDLDVTGGMMGKIQEIRAIKEKPIRCVVYNAGLEGNTYKALSGQEVGTTIMFK